MRRCTFDLGQAEIILELLPFEKTFYQIILLFMLYQVYQAKTVLCGMCLRNKNRVIKNYKCVITYPATQVQYAL